MLRKNFRDRLNTLYVVALVVLIGSEFVYRGDFSLGEDSPVQSIIRECNSTFRMQPFKAATAGVGLKDDITERIGRVFEIGQDRDLAEVILQDAGFELFDFNSPRGIPSDWNVKKYDRGFVAKKKTDIFSLMRRHVCNVYFFESNNKLVELRIFATVNY
jgi:hypothetical protein